MRMPRLLLVLALDVTGERGDERLLGDLDATDHLHALLALLLLLEQLPLTADVTAVALGEHILAEGADRLAGDDAWIGTSKFWRGMSLRSRSVMSVPYA